jgi:hypothetical protein
MCFCPEIAVLAVPGIGLCRSGKLARLDIALGRLAGKVTNREE